MREPAEKLRTLLKLADPVSVEFQRTNLQNFDGFNRETLEYEGLEGDRIPAFLFTPDKRETIGGVIVYHQHAGEFHLGKSEVAGDRGDPFQAFGPALAQQGFAVLAPDAITFEERRTFIEGVDEEESDWLQHYNGMAYRLIEDDTIMRKVLDDAQRALGVLRVAANLKGQKIGVVGHSYGGLVALYHAALDERCEFACISGAVCSFEERRRTGTGINMFEVVPGLANQFEVHELLSAISPRPALVVSATDDKYSKDADEVVKKIPGASVTQIRAEGGHALDRKRFDAIIDWVVERSGIGH